MDHVFKECFKNKEHFADFMNAALFDGRPAVKPENMQPYDIEMTTVDDEKYMSHERLRDVMVMYECDGERGLLGIENQSSKDKLVPLRDAIYTKNI